MKDTRTDLVAELRKLTPPVHLFDFYAETIKEAEAGEYHDFKNRKYDCGKIAVVGRLHTLGFHDLRQQVIRGEFDEQADEADKAMLRKETPESMWDALDLRPKP